MSLDLREAQKRPPSGCTPYTKRPSSTASCGPSSGPVLKIDWVSTCRKVSAAEYR